IAKAKSSDHRRVIIEAFELDKLVRKPIDEVIANIEDRLKRLQDPARNIRWEEYQQFVDHLEPFGENTEFEIRPSRPPAELTPWIDKVVIASRLREVRALRGFTRLVPPTPGEDHRVAKISVRPLDWLPAIENRGEGIFLQLRLERVKAWEARP